MAIGKVWPAERQEYCDAFTGARVCQLTNYKGNSNHLYFTQYGWYDDDTKLLIGSDRGNRTNLCGVDLQTGEITQLTDLAPQPPPNETYLLRVAINPVRPVAYFGCGRQLVGVHLHTCEVMPLWHMPDGFLRTMPNVTADGRYVMMGVYQNPATAADTSALLASRYTYGGSVYRGAGGTQREIWESRPVSRIVRIATDGSGTETIWEEGTWINHVNTSPTQPHLLTFCHEGPWHLVDHRIWGLDAATGRAWRIRERKVPYERVGHEYWFVDGVHIGYHGEEPDGTRTFGRVRYDDAELFEAAFPFDTGHMHSNDFTMVVGDGGQEVRLWRWSGKAFEGPRALCVHRSSKSDQMFHVHPRFRSDGRQVVYTSDVPGYGQVFVADVPPFDELPTIPEPGR